MARVYFNENDQFAARWIGNIYPQATVDKRSISDVQGSDTNGFDRCHFFGGIAGWEYALQLAGWPEGRQVWTGSCPCQPFSICGKGEGEKDKRHLWPEFLRLIQEQRPPVVFGEQVASPDGRKWLAGVRADLESVGYAVGAADLCAAGVGAPHIRQRLYWVAHRDSGRLKECDAQIWRSRIADQNGTPSGMGNAPEQSRERQPGGISRAEEKVGSQWKLDGNLHLGSEHAGSGLGQWSRQTDSFWGTADWIFCRDGKWRRVSSPESGVLSMVDGLSGEMGDLSPSQIAEIERGVTDCANKTKSGPGKVLRNVWKEAFQEAVQWRTGGNVLVQEATVLLALLRKLKDQGWKFAEGVPRSGEEAEEIGMRVLRGREETSGSSPRPRLDEQFSREFADTLHVLSSLLARHADQAWRQIHSPYAGHAWPLGGDRVSRVGSIRGYGNSIVPQLAAKFIQASMEAISLNATT